MNDKVIKLIDVDENEYVIKVELTEDFLTDQIVSEAMTIIEHGCAVVEAPDGEAVIFSSQCAALYWAEREAENENVEF